MSCHLGRWLRLFLLLSAAPLTAAEQTLNGTVAEVPDDVVLIRTAEPGIPGRGTARTNDDLLQAPSSRVTTE